MTSSLVPLVEVLKKWESSPGFLKNITTKKVLPARDGIYSPFPVDMEPRIINLLNRRGIVSLYSHQAEAWSHIRKGQNVCIVTPTASGKSLCYHLPVLARLLESPQSRALYVFPTKALAQDQYSAVHSLIRDLDVPIGTFTFDGDTPQDARRAVRSDGQIVITNPDMLHSGILPQHTKWVRLFENLEFVIIDEIHTYRGVFGSHLANIVRRLNRIAKFYRASPQFVVCSATIANPAELATQIIGQEVITIDKSGAPRGERTIYFYNPPVINKELGIRQSAVKTAKRLALDLLRHKISTILFAMSRLQVEILVKYLRDSLEREHHSPQIVQGYRGGYLPNHRRRIEVGLRSGEIKGIVATNALELGIDIGQLAACFVVGYPGTVASLWQQSGRAGRRSDAAATVFIARSNPLDQFLVQNPDYFFELTPEHARIHPDNLFIVVDHIKCAAFELPFQDGEGFGDLSVSDTTAILTYLTDHRVLNYSNGKFHWSDRAFPANQVNLRNIPGENTVVIDVETQKVLAEVDFKSTQTSLHDHAIYNIDAKQYQVERLDWDNHKAYVRKVKPDYYTDAMTYSRVSVVHNTEAKWITSTLVEHGEVSVTRKVIGFKKVRFYTAENVGFGDVILPELTMHTSSYWFTIPQKELARLPFDTAEILDGLLGISHALFYVALLAVMCDAADLGRCVGEKSAKWAAPSPDGVSASNSGLISQKSGISSASAPPTLSFGDFDPTVFIYDSYPGGVGFSAKLFEQHNALISGTYQLIVNCKCERGCPSCVGPLLNANVRSKDIPLRILRDVVGFRSTGEMTSTGMQSIRKLIQEQREQDIES